MQTRTSNARHFPSQRKLLLNCEGCRVRHLKCDSEALTCRHCSAIGLTCIRRPNIRFRNQADGMNGGDLTFPVDQVWVEPESGLRYYDETPYLSRFYQDEASLDISTTIPSTSARTDQSVPMYLQDITANSAPDTLDVVESDEINVTVDRDAVYSPYSPGVNNVMDSPGLHAMLATPAAQDSSPQSIRPVVLQEHYTGLSPVVTPLSILTNESANVQESMDLQYESFRPPDTWMPFLSDREAILVRNFIDNMALWADVTDPARHFELEVPRRAMRQPVLRFAVLAFSSRHLTRGACGDGTEAMQYHNGCLQLLITAIAGSDITEDVLAAVAILRQFEEMDETDNRFHLTGTTRILNSINRFGSSGGLGEAAAWLCLRQDIYVSLVSQHPLKTHLANFERSEVFWRQDDMAWACRMVYLLAKVLSYAFIESTTQHDDILQHLALEVDNWNATRPSSFEPIKYIPAGPNHDQRLPEIWLLSASHVVGRQYYHIAKIVLAVSVRLNRRSGYENLRHGRRMERVVRDHLLTILGLAKSNERAENTLFTARHAVSVWGGVLHSRLDQAAAEEFLRSMEYRTGWSADQLILALREQWHENSDRG